MANSLVVSRAHIAYAVCLPLAVLLGFMLAEPQQMSTEGLVFMVLSVLALPLFIRWYHPMLVFGWNAVLTLSFLPGQPSVWVLLAVIGLGVAIINRATNPEAKFISVPSITWPMLFLATVVLGTAWMTGGIGMRALGNSSYGGKTYLFIGAAIVGYFAFTGMRIPENRVRLYVSVFFLIGLTFLIPNILYLFGSSAYFLYNFFPAGLAMDQARADYGLGPDFVRYQGLANTAQSVILWLLAMYGLGGVFDWKRPVRLVLFMAGAVALLFGGFRSGLIAFCFTIAVLFFSEGLFRWRTVLINLGIFLVGAAILLPNTERLPTIVQRTLSFLPVEVSPAVRASAEGSSEWRLNMWKDVLPDVPKYFFKGKGCGIDPTDMAFAPENEARGFAPQYSWAIITGVYHSGPLTVIIPFGIWGVIALVWLWAASLKYMYRCFRYGNPAFRTINTFLFAYYMARVLNFLLVVGSLSIDLATFTALAGLAVSINGPEPRAKEAVEEEEVLPSYRKAAEPQLNY